MITDITNNGKTFRYDSDALTIEQMIVVNEIWEFKRAQIAKPPAKLEQLRQSGGDDYFQRSLANLFLEVAGDKVSKYARHRADGEVYDWVRSLPSKYYSDLKAVLDDFFQLLGRSEIVTDVLDRSGMNVVELLESLSSLTNLQSALEASANSSDAKSKSSTSTTQANCDGE
jgi:hypothetical protein